jgi:hypothetical protein
MVAMMMMMMVREVKVTTVTPCPIVIHLLSDSKIQRISTQHAKYTTPLFLQAYAQDR